jgi:2-dehydro-3-deoxyphosphogluconate aldolase / (4S)-4-hydroxy-2-oxoglutarate aldolase
LKKLVKKPAFCLNKFQEVPVLAIIRGVSHDSIKGVMESCILGGLKFVELTLNTVNSLELIELASHHFSKELCIGAGTVLSLADVKRAENAGAKFIVSPTLNIDIAEYCLINKLAYFPGALTPTEIEKAWSSGASMVKVFPASQMGSDYFNTLIGPFDKFLLMAVGGINISNAVTYLNSGASAIAIGGSVFSISRMKNREFDSIKTDISNLLLTVKKFCSKS